MLAGYPMIDIRVTLYDGKAHSVDSSDMAFQKAGRAALRDAAEHGQVLLLEPVDEVSVLVRRRLRGRDHVRLVLPAAAGCSAPSRWPAGGPWSRPRSRELEIIRYAIDLRSMSHGTGSFSRSYLRHEPLPSHLAGKVAEESKTG